MSVWYSSHLRFFLGLRAFGLQALGLHEDEVKRRTVDMIDLIGLSGYAATNYNPRHNGHHFIGYGVASVLRTLNESNSRISTETITIGMYSRARVELRDKRTKRLLRTVWLDEEIIPGGVVAL